MAIAFKYGNIVDTRSDRRKLGRGKVDVSPFRGIASVLPTPFRPDGAIDESAFVRIIDYCCEDGRANGLVMFGLASEFYKLSDAERARLTRLLTVKACGRLPVIVSVTAHSTYSAVRQAWDAVSAGADALMVLPPFFLHPAPDTVLQHIAEVAGAVRVPVMLQYAPDQTGMSFTPENLDWVRRRCPNITCVKVDFIAPGDMIRQLRAASGDALETSVGYQGMHLPEAVRLGAVGCMPTPAVTASLNAVFSQLHSNPEHGRADHARLVPLLTYMMQSIEFMIACEKQLLAMRGILPNALLREPSVALTASQCDKLQALSEVLL